MKGKLWYLNLVSSRSSEVEMAWLVLVSISVSGRISCVHRLGGASG